jgi:hypothetical protein
VLPLLAPLSLLPPLSKRQIREPLPEPKKKRGRSTFVYKPKTLFKRGYKILRDDDPGKPLWTKGMKFKDAYKKTTDTPV